MLISRKAPLFAVRKPFVAKRGAAGLTLIDVAVLLAVIAVLAALLLPALRKAGKNRWIGCFSNLKQVSLSFSLFANEHDGRFPMQVSTNQSGTMELLQPDVVVPHFVALSNILGSPKVLACYRDTNRTRALRFEELSSRNVSYLINADADMPNANQLLVSDDHLLSDSVSTSGFMAIKSDSKLRWADGRHFESGTFTTRPKGQVAFVDGSARRIGNEELVEYAKRLEGATNRFLKSTPPVK